MQKVSRETCQQYVARRLSEGWRIAGRFRHTVYLSPPDGAFLRPVDLRNDVETLRPNAAGDETSIEAQYPASDEHWDKVDEEDADDNSTSVKTDAELGYHRDLYSLPASSGSGTINSVKIYFRCKEYYENAHSNAKPSLKSDSTVTDGTEVELTADWETFSQQWDTNPADSQPWGDDWSVIDDLQIGVSLAVNTSNWNTAYCTQVYVEVDYVGVTEKSSSDTGSGADAVDSLETGEAKSSSDAGSGVEGTPMQSAILAGSETGFSIEALIGRLLAAVDTGGGVEAGGLLKNLFATEPGRGSDSLTAKIEMPAKGGGMKLWT